MNVKQLVEEYLKEYLKCKQSFTYFCTNYIYLELPGGDQLIKPYKKQIELVDYIERERYVIVLKSRQIGISTIIQAYVAWLVVFYSNVVVGIISKDGAEATDFARVIRGMIEKLPVWMKPKGGLLGRGFAKRTERSFILTNGSKVYASPVPPNAPDKTLRGKAVTLLVIDEAAFVNHLDSAWTSLVPALSTSQKHAKQLGIPYGTIVLSTPNKTTGVGKWFFERYKRAISGNDIFKPFIIYWKSVPELANDPDWYNKQCALFNHDERRIAQELELKFLPAHESFFQTKTIEEIQESCVEPIEKIKLFNGEVWKFQEPERGRFYIVGVDTASEHGQDKSAIEVFDYETLEQVWEYQGKCKVLDFIKVCKVAASMFPGLIVVESNSYGNQVVEHLNESEYATMLYKEKRGENKLVAGLTTSPKTRPLMIDALYSYITQYPNIVKSQRLALELAGLVPNRSGKVEAEEGSHDDLALATACCMYVRKYDPPLMIESSVSNTISNELANIVSANVGNSPLTSQDEIITLNSLESRLKDKIDSSQKGLQIVDVLSLYK